MNSQTDPLITCPHCRTDIRLTESLAAPLVQATRDQYEARLRSERETVAAAAAKQARLELSGELEAKSKELADLGRILRERDEKLKEAQQAQAEAIRKQRELDDARRELDLTVQKQVQEFFNKHVRDRSDVLLQMHYAPENQFSLSAFRLCSYGLMGPRDYELLTTFKEQEVTNDHHTDQTGPQE